VDEDEPLFLSLISDLFPGIQLDVAVYADLQKAISSQVADAKLINHPPWNLKVIQVGILSIPWHTLARKDSLSVLLPESEK